MTSKEIKDITLESLRDWFKKEKWVRISSSGNIAGPCGTSKNKKNPDLWIRFLKTYRKHSVRFFWIKGHNNNPTNERCDFLAVQASKNKVLKTDTYYENN